MLYWLDRPSDASWTSAAELLRELGALDGAGRPTPRGARMAGLGVHPRLAAVALEGAELGLGPLACAAAAVLSDRDGSRISGDADFRRRLSVLRGAEGDRSPSLAAWLARTADLAADLASRLDPAAGRGPFRFAWSAGDEASVGTLLLAGFPDRIARRQESGMFRFPSGREVRVDGPLAAEEWLAAVDAEAGDRSGVARLAAPLGRAEAERALAAAFPESTAEELRVEWDGLVPRAKAARRAGRLVLSERRVQADAASLSRAVGELLAEKGLSVLPWDEGEGAPRRFLERARFWAFAVGDGALSEALSDQALAAGAASWIGPFLRTDGKAGAPVLGAGELSEALRALVGWEQAVRVDREAPERLETPAGTKRRLSYGEQSVSLDVRIQEVFGLAETPRIAGVPVLLRLLSPAERPLQVTADLAGFWRGTYAEVRKEMRGRYPRHYWPEDPLVAEPTSRPKPRGT